MDDHEFVPPDYRPIVRVFVNAVGLTHTYRQMGLLKGKEDFATFIRGFNKTDPLFEIIDAGSEKECADSKIRGAWIGYGIEALG